MYGYFRPDHSKLSGEEHKVFNSYYCRLCYCLRRLGGQAARFFTSYDVAVYSMILNLSQKAPRPPFLVCQRLRTGNMKLFDGDRVGRGLACLSAIGVAEKFADDVADENSLKGRLGLKLFSKVFKKAREAEPEIAAIIHAGIARVDELQRAGEDFEAIMDVYGNMFADAFCCFSPLDENFRKVYFHLARWIFFIDELCDYDEDYKKSRYNPFRQDGLSTFKEYFNRNYAYVIDYCKRMNSALADSLVAIKDDSAEWRAVYKIITYAMGTVAASVAGGDDVQFHYLKVQRHRLKQEILRRKKSNFR